ncbi:uncharacterized protein [Dermacentor albipictus]|uniref:uncharacterized protein n=1 Tax=Dermacentor albipictus TaxID=60249 RepID=UPI0031FDB811
MSSYKPDETELSVLSLGLSFNAQAATHKKKFVCAVENAVSHVDPTHRDDARIHVVSVLSRLWGPHSSSLSSEERQAVKRARGNRKVMILPADKGNATILLDQVDYSQKMPTLLVDTNTYLQFDWNRTPKMQRDYEKLLDDVFRMSPPP